MVGDRLFVRAGGAVVEPEVGDVGDRAGGGVAEKHYYKHDFVAPPGSNVRVARWWDNGSETTIAYRQLETNMMPTVAYNGTRIIFELDPRRSRNTRTDLCGNTHPGTARPHAPGFPSTTSRGGREPGYEVPWENMATCCPKGRR